MQENSTSGSAPLGRMIWMMIGPATLFLLGLNIVLNGGGWLSKKNIAFLAVLGVMIIGRFLEFRGGDPRTASGEPATRDHLRRYIMLVLVTGLGVWTIVNLIGNRSP